MALRLTTPFYIDKNPVRQGELMYCLHKNLAAGFAFITFVCESAEHILYLDNYLKVIKENPAIVDNKPLPEIYTWNTGRRPTFNQLLSVCAPSDINVISNSDIYFTPDTIEKIKAIYAGSVSPPALCLSRYDVDTYGNSTLFERADSQDAWVITGAPKGSTTTDFTMGVAGCDNRFAWELKNMGYEVINPSKTIQIFHKHGSNVRNYLNAEGAPTERVPAPYELVTPV